MRKVAIAALTVTFLVSCYIARAVSPPSDTTRPAAGQPKGVNLSGRISADGKVLHTDDDNDWSVINSDTLKGFEGRYITVKCRINQEKRAIRVLFVVEDPQFRRSVNLGDPAFRR